MPQRAALVTALIVDRPTCEACILTKTGLGRDDYDETMVVLRSALRVHDEIGRCRACGVTGRVLSLDHLA